MVAMAETNVIGLTMANSDYFVLRALKRINGKQCTYEDIINASEIKCSELTIWRSLKRMQSLGLIKKISRGNRWAPGCIYHVKDGVC